MGREAKRRRRRRREEEKSWEKRRKDTSGQSKVISHFIPPSLLLPQAEEGWGGGVRELGGEDWGGEPLKTQRGPSVSPGPQETRGEIEYL